MDMRLKRGAIMSIVLMLFVALVLISVSSTSEAGYMQHWSNPKTIRRGQNTSLSFIVLSSFENSESDVTIELEGDIKRYAELEETQIRLGNTSSDNSDEEIEVDIRAIEDIGYYNGTVIIKHKSNSSDGGTGVEFEDKIPLEIEVEEEEKENEDGNIIMDNLELLGLAIVIIVILIFIFKSKMLNLKKIFGFLCILSILLMTSTMFSAGDSMDVTTSVDSSAPVIDVKDHNYYNDVDKDVIDVEIEVDVYDPDGDPMDLEFMDLNDNESVIESMEDVSNGTYSTNKSWKRWSNISYRVSVDDGNETTNLTKHFDVPNPDASVSIESSTATIQKHVNEWAKDRRNFTLDFDEQTNTTIQLYNLTADESYQLYVDGELEKNLTANDNGTIEFEWGNWSEHTFLVELADDDTSGGLGILTDDDNFLAIPNWFIILIIAMLVAAVFYKAVKS